MSLALFPAPFLMSRELFAAATAAPATPWPFARSPESAGLAASAILGRGMEHAIATTLDLIERKLDILQAASVIVPDTDLRHELDQIDRRRSMARTLGRMTVGRQFRRDLFRLCDWMDAEGTVSTSFARATTLVAIFSSTLLDKNATAASVAVQAVLNEALSQNVTERVLVAMKTAPALPSSRGVSQLLTLK